MHDNQAAMVRAAFKQLRSTYLSQEAFPGARVATGNGDMDPTMFHDGFDVADGMGKTEIDNKMALLLSRAADAVRTHVPAGSIVAFRIEPRLEIHENWAGIFCAFAPVEEGSEAQPLGGPALTWPTIMHLPADVEPLPEEEVIAMFEEAFSPAAYADPPQDVRLGFKKWQRTLVTLDRERQQVGRLRHWVASAGSNVKKPDAEAKVLFLAASTALNSMVGGDMRSALEVLELAVNQAALSRAGKLQLDMGFWAQVETRATGGVQGKDLVRPVGADEGVGHSTSSDASENDPRPGPGRADA